MQRYAGDALVAALAWYGAAFLRIHIDLPYTRSLLPADRFALTHQAILLVVTLQLLLIYFTGGYESPEPRPRLLLASRLAGAVVLLCLMLFGYAFLADYGIPRSVVVLFGGLDLALLLAWRVAEQRRHLPGLRRVALVGAGAAARELEARIAENRWHGLEVVGYLTLDGEEDVDDGVHPRAPALGSIDEAGELLRAGRFDDLILVARPDSWQSRVLDRLAGIRPRHSSVFLLPGPFESMVGRMRYRWVSDIPLIEVVGSSEWTQRFPLKRLFDIALASLLGLVSLPLVLGSALAILVTDRGPVLYRQTRVGRSRRPFTLLKLRTMRLDAEADEEVLASENDDRLIPIGGVLRRTRLDELPQLWNVLSGSMSLVGPRPERPGFVRQYLDEVSGYAERFSVLPGLTGLAQVNGEYDSSPENKLRYDLAYVANASLWLDLSILFRTVRIVLTSRGV